MKAYLNEKLSVYVSQMNHADESEVSIIKAKFSEWYDSTSPAEKKEMEPFWVEIKDTARKAIQDIKEMVRQIKVLNDAKIVVGDEEYDLHDWVTISDYSKIRNLKVSRVQNWIARGIVPDDKVLTLPQLNNLKLIKNEMYGKQV